METLRLAETPHPTRSCSASRFAPSRPTVPTYWVRPDLVSRVELVSLAAEHRLLHAMGGHSPAIR